MPRGTHSHSGRPRTRLHCDYCTMTFKEPWQKAQHVKLSHPAKTRNALRRRMGVQTPVRERLSRAEPSVDRIQTPEFIGGVAATEVPSPGDYHDLDQNSYDLGYAAGLQAGMLKVLAKKAA